MVLVDTAGIISYSNQSAQDVLKQVRLVGLSIQKILPGFDVKSGILPGADAGNPIVIAMCQVPVILIDLVVVESILGSPGSIFIVFSSLDPLPTLKQMEKMLIERTFAGLNSNITKIARSLGISRNTLYGKMKKYQING